MSRPSIRPLPLALVALLLAPAAQATLPIPTYPMCGEVDRPDLCPAELGSEWYLISYVPEGARESVREAELTLGAGMWADQAWRVTTGRFDVLLAVVDSGVEWHSRDIVNKLYVNTGELPLPQLADGSTAASHDANGDGLVNVQDWSGDSRVLMSAGRDAADDMLDPSDLIYTFSDGVDDDDNGYTDDISGWDFYGRDNDAWSDYAEDFGTHGTGVMEEMAAEGEDGRGDIGVCPNCAILPVRIGDTFVTDGARSAEGIVFAVNSGAVGITQSVGTLSAPDITLAAAQYAFDHGVSIVGATGDENAYHHNFPAVLNNILYVHSIRHNSSNSDSGVYSYMNTWNCNNYGERLTVVAPSSACATGSVANTVGLVGLIHSAARDAGLSLTAGEVYQVIVQTADDVWLSEEEIDEAQAYPSAEGWDPFYGYGRVNAARAVSMVSAGQIPPWISIDSPQWFENVVPGDQPTLEVEGTISAQRSSSYTYTVDLGLGHDPQDWSSVGGGSGTDQQSGVLATIDLAALPTPTFREAEEGEGILARLERVGAGAVTLRVRVTDAEGRVGEQRKTFYLQPDPDLKPGFPFWLGSSGESSPILADLDGDDVFEIIVASTSGDVYALTGDGALLPGWPASTDLHPQAHPEAAGWSSGEIPAHREQIIGTVAVGDIDGDGAPEVVAASHGGGVYAWEADGSPVSGWPVRSVGRGSDEFDTDHRYDQGYMGAPTLVDLDGDGALEVMALGLDSRLYAWTGAGQTWGPYPIEVCHPDNCGRSGNMIITSPTVGDVDGDGDIDVGFGSNEATTGDRYSVSYLLDANTGLAHDGWPREDSGLVNVAVLLPLIGEGHPASMGFADLDGDGDLEISNPVMLGTTPLLHHTGDTYVETPYYSEDFGAESNADNVPAFVQFISQPAFGDMTGDGNPDFLMGGASSTYLVSLAFTKHYDFQNPLGAWDGTTGEMLPAWPRQIEDAQFLMSPAVADVSGDGRAEVIYGSAGYFLHAWDAEGVEAAGWPKSTGNWLLGSPAVGDIDGDGYLDVVVTSREGWVYAWGTEGRADQAVQWQSIHHDAQNTGNYETPLPTQAGPAEGPLGDSGGGAEEEAKGGAYLGSCACGGGEEALLLLLPVGWLGLRRRRSAG